MAVQSVKSSVEAIDSEEVRQTLTKILNSRYFIHAHKKRQFLNVISDFYLNGRAHELNEYVLAYDVFGRDRTYNPSADPIVRVVAHEIRKKLESYYQSEGASDEIRLELPAGSYQPVFLRHHPPPSVQIIEEATPLAAKAEAAAGRRPFSPVTIILGAATLALTIAVIFLALSNRALQQKIGDSTDPAVYGEVWESFLRSSTSPVVVLSNPLVPRLSNANEPDILLRGSVPLSPEALRILRAEIVTNPQTLAGESAARGAERVNGQSGSAIARKNYHPNLFLSNSSYTGLGEAIGLHYLTNFFRTTDRDIVLKQSRTLSAEDLKNRNVIMLGGAWVNEWSGKLPDDEDFVYGVNTTIVNRKPQAGEEREYIPQFDSRTGNLLTDYALITLKPNLTAANKVMVLSGVYSEGTEAAAEFITDRNYLDQINQQLRQKNISHHFQALLKVGVENGIPTTISILALHKLP
jgi:hypothetical protein